MSTATLDAVGYGGGGCGDPSLLVSLAVSAADGAAPQVKVQLLEVGLVPHGAGWLATTITPVSTPTS